MNRKFFVSAAFMALLSVTGCASGRIHEKSYLRAVSVSGNQLVFSLFNIDGVIVGAGDDMHSARRSAELIGGKPIFTGYTELVIVDGEDSLGVLGNMLREWKLSPSCRVVCSENGEELLRSNDAELLIGITDQAVKQGIAPPCDIIAVLGELCHDGQAETAELHSDGTVGSCVIR
ncbi:hypothetical protein [Ruminococcus flavefaciens]|uniref:hypothetical protein n=1 Tax=Ruminococcus flavefaciens TaxID=1265 RepID=UPI0026EF6629|nr:hypothetical protein [Ruminococcus flavefaciens]